MTFLEYDWGTRRNSQIVYRCTGSRLRIVKHTHLSIIDCNASGKRKIFYRGKLKESLHI